MSAATRSGPRHASRRPHPGVHHRAGSLIIGLVVALVAAACGTGPPEHVRVGLVAPLSGPRAFLGQEILNGARYAIEDLNREGGLLGRDVELVVADDGDLVDLPSRLADLAERQRVSVVVGPETPGILLGPRSPLSRRDTAALLPTAQAGDLAAAGTTLVRTIPSAAAQTERLGRWLTQERGLTRVAVLVADPIEGDVAADAVVAGLRAGGADVVAVSQVDGDAPRLTPAVAALRGDAPDADAVVLWGPPTSAARATLAVRELGWDVQVAVSASALVAEFRTLTGAASEGVVMAAPFRDSWFRPRMQNWLVRYLRDHGIGAIPQLDTLVVDIPVLALAAYDAVLLAAAAVEAAGSREPAAVAAALGTVEVDGLLRTYRAATGEAWGVDDLYVARFHQLAVVFDADPRLDAARQRTFWGLQVGAGFVDDLGLSPEALAAVRALFGTTQVPTYRPPAPPPGPVVDGGVGGPT